MRLCVGHLALITSEKALRQLCAPDGIVERVQIITARETDRSRGFGCVEMPNATETTATLAGLQGTPCGGRTFTINEARSCEGRDGPQRPRW
jgi:cold-inducible RNA-binding protein